MPLNPARITNNFRLQTLIEAELDEAKKLLATKSKEELTSADLANLALIFLETANWDAGKLYIADMLALEEKKPEGSKDIESLCTVHYLSATEKREANRCDEALKEYQEALNTTKSDWLKGNLLRNIGLVYLKKQEFDTAADFFKQALDFTESCDSRAELRGSIPALSNYYGLSLTRQALKLSQDPAAGLKVLEDTTKLYETIFTEKGISAQDRLKAHDYNSHLCHRGMVLCEMAENKLATQEMLQQSEKLLLEALTCRRENKARDQIMGDACMWLGRIYVQLNQIENAKDYFKKALAHYQVTFAKTPDAMHIKDVIARLNNLAFMGLAAPSAFGLGLHTQASSSLQAPEAPKTSQTITETPRAHYQPK
jgi:tetratricopeptide (TPR) repeat protein